MTVRVVTVGLNNHGQSSVPATLQRAIKIAAGQSYTLALVAYPRPTLLLPNSQYLTNAFVIEVEAPTGMQYRLESTENFVDWVPVTNFIATRVLTRIWDDNISAVNARFYRVVRHSE
jgi:hypothetical protein